MSREGKRGSRQRRVSRERQKEIERDNVILLQKMMKINEKGGRNGETFLKLQKRIYSKMNGHMCGNDVPLWLENGPIHTRPLHTDFRPSDGRSEHKFRTVSDTWTDGRVDGPQTAVFVCRGLIHSSKYQFTKRDKGNFL